MGGADHAGGTVQTAHADPAVVGSIFEMQDLATEQPAGATRALVGYVIGDAAARQIDPRNEIPADRHQGGQAPGIVDHDLTERVAT